MVEISVHGSTLRIDVLGVHKIWAFKSKVEVPLASVRQIIARPDMKLGLWHGWRLPGTHLPGVIVAGSYLDNGRWTFWDVSNSRNTVEIIVDGQRYERLFVEVADPEETRRTVRGALTYIS